MTLSLEAARRRSFAIISHPDAGKTTLTEQLLLAGGAIRAAGMVRARGEARRTRSDWMKIEQERGISVTASVMTFEHDGLMFNLLDTPGHEDFSEDTYRTLTAANSAIMVLDAAKGIEAQTLKLFEVCRLRDIPIITFINKMDRESQDPFSLIDEISNKLALDPAPLYWPSGSGSRFRGMLDLRRDHFLPYSRQAEADLPQSLAFRSNAISGYLKPEEVEELQDHAGLIREVAKPFDPKAFFEGHLTPVIFGSALRHFGIRELLGVLADFAPPPQPIVVAKSGLETHTAPSDAEVSGFVFKIQANMDPNHRDRIAMVRLCSGRFQRGMKLRLQNKGRQISVNAPILFFASDRQLAEEAYAGDIIGIPNHGVLRLGDSLSETGDLRFRGLPNFAPEILLRARIKDPLKAKHLKKALESLAEEGVTQLFRPLIGSDFLIGAVGQLQVEVMANRLVHEYQLEVLFEAAPFSEARWVEADPKDLDELTARYRGSLAKDAEEDLVFLGKNTWEINYAAEKFPKVKFLSHRERA